MCHLSLQYLFWRMLEAVSCYHSHGTCGWSSHDIVWLWLTASKCCFFCSGEWWMTFIDNFNVNSYNSIYFYVLYCLLITLWKAQSRLLRWPHLVFGCRRSGCIWCSHLSHRSSSLPAWFGGVLFLTRFGVSDHRDSRERRSKSPEAKKQKSNWCLHQ